MPPIVDSETVFADAVSRGFVEFCVIGSYIDRDLDEALKVDGAGRFHSRTRLNVYLAPWLASLLNKGDRDLVPVLAPAVIRYAYLHGQRGVDLMQRVGDVAGFEATGPALLALIESGAAPT